jgi:hypothetical protein
MHKTDFLCNSFLYFEDNRRGKKGRDLTNETLFNDWEVLPTSSRINMYSDYRQWHRQMVAGLIPHDC